MADRTPPSFDSPSQFASKFSPQSFAIASFVFALSGLIVPVFSSLIAIILGHIALRGIRNTDYQGRVFAWSGLVLGYVCLTWVLILFVGLS